MEAFPLSIGLLISMAYRYNHSFGSSFGSILKKEDKQISLVNFAYSVYINRETCANLQLLEEMTGKGFYRPDRELMYCKMATPEAILHASKLIDQTKE